MYEPNSQEEKKTKTACECDRPILNDERAIQMGFMCVKCGHSAENRLVEYMQNLGIKLTPKKFRRISD